MLIFDLLLADNPNPLFGKKLHDQVEDRLTFYDTGEAPKKNLDVMREAIAELNKSVAEGDEQGEKKKKKKKKGADKEEKEAAVEVKEESDVKDKKKKKKQKVEGMYMK